MQTIGERLEEARKRKGISIREAAEHTKIRGDYLQKFEANSFDIDLPPLYIRGFIRTYSRYLELDPERLVNDVDAALARDGKPARREHREALGRVDFGTTESRTPEATETGAGGRAARDKAMLIKFGLLGGGAIVVIVLIVLLINVLFSRPAAKPATASEQSPITAHADAVQTLVITGIEASRVKVVQDLDGTVLLDNVTIGRGEARTIKKQGALRITVEDRTKVRIEVNGRAHDIPPLQGGNFGRFLLD
jgi:cytoskeleton protein RodZ